MAKSGPFQTWKGFGLLQIQKTSCIFKVCKMDLKLCTYFTGEDTYLSFDRKKSGPFQTLRYMDLRFMLDGKLVLSIPSIFFLSKQFETLYKCYRHTVKMYVLFYKGKIF